MNDNLDFYHLQERLDEHQRRADAHVLRMDATRASGPETCGTFCQLKRRVTSLRTAPHFS
jgi:hypothetical protein